MVAPMKVWRKYWKIIKKISSQLYENCSWQSFCTIYVEQITWMWCFTAGCLLNQFNTTSHWSAYVRRRHRLICLEIRERSILVSAVDSTADYKEIFVRQCAVHGSQVLVLKNHLFYHERVERGCLIHLPSPYFLTTMPTLTLIPVLSNHNRFPPAPSFLQSRAHKILSVYLHVLWRCCLHVSSDYRPAFFKRTTSL